MKKRFLAVLCACLCLCILLAACGETGGGSDDTRVVFTLNEYEVIADTYRYFYLTYGMELAEAADYAVKVSHIDQKLRSFAETSICDLYAVYSLAEEYGITLTDARKEQMEADLAAIFAEAGGEDAYYDMCEAYYMTGDLFRMLSLESVYLQNDLYNHLKTNVFAGDKETVLADIAENFYHCSQVFFPVVNEEYKENVRTSAQNALADIRAGGHSFAEYAEDPVSGTYYTKGQVHAPFEAAALSLAEGEISEVIETEVGFHIIMRLPMNSTQIETQYADLRELYFQRLFTDLLAKRAGQLELARARKHDAVLADLAEELAELITKAKAAQA